MPTPKLLPHGGKNSVEISCTLSMFNSRTRSHHYLSPDDYSLSLEVLMLKFDSCAIAGMIDITVFALLDALL